VASTLVQERLRLCRQIKGTIGGGFLHNPLGHRVHLKTRKILKNAWRYSSRSFLAQCCNLVTFVMRSQFYRHHHQRQGSSWRYSTKSKADRNRNPFVFSGRSKPALMHPGWQPTRPLGRFPGTRKRAFQLDRYSVDPRASGRQRWFVHIPRCIHGFWTRRPIPRVCGIRK
jgi:hypothetical protein